ncbi:MAG: hypothetical protein ACP5KK_03360 [Candidatus Nanoarchaeia archaeon]
MQNVPALKPPASNEPSSLEAQTSEIFAQFLELEKSEEFVRFFFEIVFNAKSSRSMLCVLHQERNPSASVFKSAVSGRYLYKDFHNYKTYSLLDLLIEYFNVPQHLQKLLRLNFARYLLNIASLKPSLKQEIRKLYSLLRAQDNNLAKAYFIIASLNMNGLNEHFISVRDIAKMLQLKNIAYANRLLNFLCLMDLIDKKGLGNFGKANAYELKAINLEKLAIELEKIKQIDIHKLNKNLALSIFDREKVESIYRRTSDNIQQKLRKSFTKV